MLRRVAASFTAITRPWLSFRRAPLRLPGDAERVPQTSSRTPLAARSRSSMARAIAVTKVSACRRRTSQGPVMSTSPTGSEDPGAFTGAAAQLHGCSAETKCSEANTSIGLPAASAVPGPFVPADASAQQAPGQKPISARRVAIRRSPSIASM
jgi:hypothetical protein